MDQVQPAGRSDGSGRDLYWRTAVFSWKISCKYRYQWDRCIRQECHRSRTADQRKALIRGQVTSLLYHGKIVTTEQKAKEIRKVAEGLIALAVKEKDNFETVTVTAKVARKDKDGKRVKEVVDGKKVTVYDEVQKEIKKDAPSRLHARRQMMKVFYPVKAVPTEAAGRKKNTKEVDMVDKMFSEIAPKYADRNGGYTRIVKIGQRKGDAAMEVLIELV